MLRLVCQRAVYYKADQEGCLMPDVTHKSEQPCTNSSHMSQPRKSRAERNSAAHSATDQRMANATPHAWQCGSYAWLLASVLAMLPAGCTNVCRRAYQA